MLFPAPVDLLLVVELEQQVLRVFTLAAETIDSDAQVFATLLFAAAPRGRAMAPEPRRRASKRPRTCHHYCQQPREVASPLEKLLCRVSCPSAVMRDVLGVLPVCRQPLRESDDPDPEV